MTDQFEPAYRTLVVACKSDKRWFDLDAVREPIAASTAARHEYSNLDHRRKDKRDGGGSGHGMMVDNVASNPAGAPPLDYWLLDTDAGVERVLKSMLPERVCRVCGEPSRRITGDTEEYAAFKAENEWASGGKVTSNLNRPDIDFSMQRVTTLGWTDCGHNDYRAGVALDPFDLTTKGSEVGQARYIIGDVFDTLATLEENSVDLIFSSPPFLALRSYLPADHPDKDKEIGSEATPADFLDTLLDVVEACDRVLAPHGSLCFELGDTFAGSGGAGGDYYEGGMHDGQPKFQGSAERNNPGFKSFNTANRNGGGGGYGWPLAKSLSGIPTLFAWSLAYGRNLLRPERETPRWRIRNLIVWARPNPPVGALGDKFRPATSYLTVACKSDKRWFDLDAVRQPMSANSHGGNEGPITRTKDKRDGGGSGHGVMDNWVGSNPAGAPPLDYWEIPTEPFAGAHYATFPRKLVIKPVESMCPKRVCKTCGEPSRRIVGEAEYPRTDTDRVPARLAMTDGERVAAGVNQHTQSNGANTSVTRTAPTLGWTDCGHNDYRAGVVLDPFCGSGTTLSVATGHGRDAIGIDLDDRNAELALQRVGPLFLEVEHLRDTGPFTFEKIEDVETEIV